MSLTELAIKRPSFVVVLFTVIALFGMMAYNSISYELLPKFDIPTLTITTLYRGASPSEIEDQVTIKVENKLSALENVKKIRSTSAENLSIVVVELKNGTDIDNAMTAAQQKLSSVTTELPDGAESPTVSKFSSDDFPILQYSLSANLSSKTDFYQFVKDKVIPRLSSAAGVASVNIVGGEERAIRVNVDEDKLKSQNLSLLMVTQAIGQNNLDIPAGKVETADVSLRVRLAGKYSSIADLENLVVARFPNGTIIKLSDVATVIDGKKETTTMNRINGESAIGINILKQSDANAIDVADILKERVIGLENDNTAIEFKMSLSNDTTNFTIEAADAVKHDLVIALFLVALVILVFLHSIRDSFIVMLAIPCSFLGTMVAMWLMGYTFNLMTLLALTLVIGILVDDSIVVLENIHRHLKMGKDRAQAALDGRNEIGFTAMAITMVDIVVFLPLALSDAGIISIILGQFSWVIVISTLLSLLVSFTVTPLLASRFATTIDLEKPDLWTKINKWIEHQINSLSNWYVRRLKWVLAHKALTSFVCFAMFAGSISLVAFGFIGSAFVEQGDRGEALIYIETDKASTIEYTDRVAQEAEKILLAMPEVKTLITRVGVSGASMVASNTDAFRAEFSIKLKGDVTLTDNEFIDKAKALLGSTPGVKVTDAVIGINGNPDDSPVQIILSSDDFSEVMTYAAEAKRLVQKIPGTKNVNLTIEGGVPEVLVKMDKEKMAKLGLNVATVGATMSNAFSGNDDSQYADNGTEYDIVVQLKDFDRKNPDDVKSLSFANNQGQLIRLDQFAEISAGIVPSKLERTDRIASVTLKAGLKGRQIGEVSPEIDAAIAAANFPNSVKVYWTGEAENQGEAFGAIGGAFGLSLVLTYLLMVLLYDNYIYPFVVLFSIPMALIGAFLALALAKSSLSIFTMMGLVMIMGLVAKNAILIVDFTNIAKAEGATSYDALILAGQERLRPIMMTTLAMVLGLLPVALAVGAGAEWKNGLGWVLVGGLTSSMCLTVFIVPVVYLAVDQLKAKFNRSQINN